MPSGTRATAKSKGKGKGLAVKGNSRITKGPNKRRVVVSDSEEEDALVANPSVVGADMARRGFVRPKNFPMDEYLRDRPVGNWGVLQMDANRMQYFYGPWMPIYPRLVRLFWQNAYKKPHSKSQTLYTKVDNRVFQISRSVIATVIQWEGRRTHQLFDTEVEQMDLHDVNLAVCDGPPEQHTYCRRVDLNHRLLIIDSVLQNVFPMSHKDERRHSFLRALYAFETEGFLHPAGLILEEMNKFFESRTDKGPIPFGPLIADILLHPAAIAREDGSREPYTIAEDEVMDLQSFVVMNKGNWEKSLKRIRVSRERRNLPNPPIVNEVAGEGGDNHGVHPPSPPIQLPPPNWSLSSAEYRSLSHELMNTRAALDYLHQRFNSFELTCARNHYDQMSLLRALMHQAPLPPFVAPIPEPFIPPYPGISRGRGAGNGHNVGNRNGLSSGGGGEQDLTFDDEG